MSKGLKQNKHQVDQARDSNQSHRPNHCIVLVGRVVPNINIESAPICVLKIKSYKMET